MHSSLDDSIIARPTRQKCRKTRSSKTYTDEELAFLRDKLSSYMQLDSTAKNSDRSLFLGATASEFISRFHDTTVPDSKFQDLKAFKANMDRWFYNASRRFQRRDVKSSTEVSSDILADSDKISGDDHLSSLKQIVPTNSINWLRRSF